MFDCVLNVSLWITQIIHEKNFHLFDIVNLHVTSKYAYVMFKVFLPFPHSVKHHCCDDIFFDVSLYLSWFTISYQMSSFKYFSLLIYLKLRETKQIIIVFEIFSLLVTSIVNKPLYLTFSITNTRSTVALANFFFYWSFFLVLNESD